MKATLFAVVAAGTLVISNGVSASPATDIYKQATDLLTKHYYGTATNLTELISKHQALLEAACAKDWDACAVAVGNKQVTELAKELDWRIILRPPGPAQTAPTPAPGPSLGMAEWPNIKTPEVMVMDVQPKGAAFKAGLLPGDRIVGVNGQAFETPASQDALWQTYQKLVTAVPVDQPVRFTVIRGDIKAPQKLEVGITRSLDGEGWMPVLYKPAGAPEGVLVLRIPLLSAPGNAQRIHDLVHEAQKQGAKALVVHLMGVRDGTYRMMNAVAGAFLGNFEYTFRTRDTTYTTGYKDGVGLGYTTDERTEKIENPALWTGKLAVLTISNNLAGGEFLPYLLQQAKRAVIIGEATTGYMHVLPDFFKLSDGSQLLVPAYRIFNADGTFWPERVTPDIVMTYDQEDFAHTGVLPMLERAYKELGF